MYRRQRYVHGIVQIQVREQVLPSSWEDLLNLKSLNNVLNTLFFVLFRNNLCLYTQIITSARSYKGPPI